MATEMQKVDSRVGNIRDLLEKSKTQIKMALPAHLKPERMLRIAMTSVQRTPGLLNCTPASLIGAIIQVAQLGLEPDTGLGHAYLIPYGSVCTLIIGYRGMIDLARRSGQISTIVARVVHEKDDFNYRFGLEDALHHSPSMEADPGPLVYVYAVCKLRDGGVQWDVMSRAQIDAIRVRAKASGNGPWKTDYEEMAKKTILRRLFKMLPTSIEQQRAGDLDTAADEGIPQGLESIINVEAEEAKAPAQIPDGKVDLSPWLDEIRAVEPDDKDALWKRMNDHYKGNPPATLLRAFELREKELDRGAA